MKLRLHEIESGTDKPEECTRFFQTVSGLKPRLQQERPTVFDPGLQGLDLNLSAHFPQGVVCLCFLTDDLPEIENRLKVAGIAYEGPSPSHLGMNALRFKSPAGYWIRVSTPTASSPDWLEV